MGGNARLTARKHHHYASFDKNEQQAEWVVRLIDTKKKAAVAVEAQDAGGTVVPPALRGNDRQRDGLGLAAYLLGMQHAPLQRQLAELEKLSGKKNDIRQDGKQAILNQLEEARRDLSRRW